MGSIKEKFEGLRHLESDRLHLRLPTINDVPELNLAVSESLDHLKPWMPWADIAPTLAETTELVERFRRNFENRDDVTLILFHKETGEVVGGSGLHRFDLSVPRFEIGYWIRSKYLNQGYATETVNTLADFVLKELDAKRVELDISSLNDLSQKVARACGFELEAINKNYRRHRIDNQVVDRLIFVRTS